LGSELLDLLFLLLRSLAVVLQVRSRPQHALVGVLQLGHHLAPLLLRERQLGADLGQLLLCLGGRALERYFRSAGGLGFVRVRCFLGALLDAAKRLFDHLLANVGGELALVVPGHTVNYVTALARDQLPARAGGRLSADWSPCPRSPHSVVDSNPTPPGARGKGQLRRPMVFVDVPRAFLAPPPFFPTLFLAVRGLPLPPAGLEGGGV